MASEPSLASLVPTGTLSGSESRLALDEDTTITDKSWRHTPPSRPRILWNHNRSSSSSLAIPNPGRIIPLTAVPLVIKYDVVVRPSQEWNHSHLKRPRTPFESTAYEFVGYVLWRSVYAERDCMLFSQPLSALPTFVDLESIVVDPDEEEYGNVIIAGTARVGLC
jgi:hypothetical protein